ncbi:hypothetical protein ATE47_08475 [Chryseobacterium sp. IHB B 17019]|uniref:hypothetical protein n=1 Tax=Chryseobacterium sp. IHB B 17019 TaxID=1721091 RepID=UPI00071EC70C|nr:hypothetical protein [Chryseobacterium sp. IHB B 17019]ALR30560.1 hypothetical protein ATE47_08475 [Chryseobacterium sp. IHB B 17019]
MKNNFLNSTLRVAKSALLAGTVFATVLSCSHDDEPAPRINHKILVKAEASTGSNITGGKHSFYADEEYENFTASGEKWTKEVTTIGTQGYDGAVRVVVNATGANASSTLKLQIYVDGTLKNESVVTGQSLQAGLTTIYKY